MALGERHADPLAVYAAHSFADDQAYQAGLSALHTSGALDDLSGEAKEEFLRRSRVFYFNQYDISESDAKRVEDERTCPHSIPGATTAQDQAVSPPILETPRTLTFAELQTLIEQGKTDEIPNNKHIPDAINVVSISYAVLGNDMLSIIFTTGGPSQPVDRPTAQKALGARIVIRMTSEDAEPRL